MSARLTCDHRAFKRLEKVAAHKAYELADTSRPGTARINYERVLKRWRRFYGLTGKYVGH